MLKRKPAAGKKRAPKKTAQAHSALERQNTFLRQVMDTNPSYISVHDRAGRLVFVNQTLADAMHLPVEAVVGKRLVELYHDPASVERFLREDLEVMDSRQELFIPEESAKSASGAQRWQQVVKRPILNADGTADQVLCVITDITERKQIEATLARRNHELDLLVRAARQLGSTLDLGQLLLRTLEEMCLLIGARGASFWMIDAATGDMVCRQAVGPDHEVILGRRIPRGKGIVGWVIECGESQLIADAPADPRYWREIVSPSGQIFRAVLVVPIFVRREIVGVLQLGDSQANRFDLADQMLVESLAATAAVAIDNAQLFAAMQHELQERHHAEAALRASEERWRMYIEQANDLIFTLDAAGKITLANQTTCHVLGYTAAELLGRSPLEFIVPDDCAAAAQAVSQILRGDGVEQIELKVVNRAGQELWLEIRGRILYENGTVSGTFHIARDVTERKRIEAELRYLSTHDALTGLCNRAYWEDQVARFEHSRQFPISIVMVDVNDMKRTNDHLGHAAGDALLRRAARILRETFRAEDVVARIGGDEFAVLLPNTDAEVAQDLLQRVRAQLTDATAPSLALGAATGAAGASLAAVMRAADARMYQDKLTPTL